MPYGRLSRSSTPAQEGILLEGVTGVACPSRRHSRDYGFSLTVSQRGEFENYATLVDSGAGKKRTVLLLQVIRACRPRLTAREGTSIPPLTRMNFYMSRQMTPRSESFLADAAYILTSSI